MHVRRRQQAREVGAGPARAIASIPAAAHGVDFERLTTRLAAHGAPQHRVDAQASRVSSAPRYWWSAMFAPFLLPLRVVAPVSSDRGVSLAVEPVQ